MLEVCPQTHTESLSKDWETYWFQVYKEISVQSLARWKLQWPHTVKNTKDFTGKSLNKEKQQGLATKTNPEGSERI